MASRPFTSHDFKQPFHRPLFVVRATDFAVGGGDDFMAPGAAQEISDIFLVPASTSGEFCGHVSTLARRQ